MKRMKRWLLMSLAGTLSFTSLAGCSFNEIVSNIGSNIASYFGVASDWFGGVVDGAASVYDDVSKYVTDAYNTVATAVGNFGEEVKDGWMTISAKTISAFSIDETVLSSTDTELYKDDPGAFILALLSSRLSEKYEVFVGDIYVPEMNYEVLGLGFTDRTEIFQSSINDNDSFYSTGFIGAYDEPEIPSSIYSEGLEINRLDDTSTGEKYLYDFSLEPFESHCIYQNKYIKFGVNELHQMFYSVATTETANYNNNLGGLYDYTNKEWVDPSVYGESNTYIDTTSTYFDAFFTPETIGNACKSELTNSSFKVSINQLLSCISNVTAIVKKTLEDYASTNFLGYTKDDLSAAINSITGSDVIDTSNDKVDIQEASSNPKTSSALVKSLVIAGTVLSIMLTITSGLFAKAFPEFTFVFSSLAGACIEIMVEVVANNKSTEDINWTKVLVASLAGGIGFVCKGVISDSLIAGLTASAFSFIDGKTVLDSLFSFVPAFFLSVVIGTIFKGVVAGIKALSPKWLAKASTFIDEHQLVLGDGSFARIGTFNEAIHARQILNYRIKNVLSFGMYGKTIKGQELRTLLSDDNVSFVKVDDNGNVLTKEAMKNSDSLDCKIKLRDNAPEDVKALFSKNGFNPGDTVATLKNGALQLSNPVCNFSLPTGIVGASPTRYRTFKACYEELAEKWSSDPSLIPESINSYFQINGIDTSSLTAGQIHDMMSAVGLTFHEVDGNLIQLVSTAIHSYVRHMGGFAVMQMIYSVGNFSLFFA